MPPTEERVKLKVCLAGEFAVGKTSLIRRFVHEVFEDRYLATVGAKVTKRELDVTLPDSETPVHAVLSIWDIMGAKGFRDLLREAYFHGTQGVLAVCDVTRPDTLADLDGWRMAVQRVVGEIPVTVLANKVDLTEEARLGEPEVRAHCARRGLPHALTSAKTGEGVEDAFEGLTRRILEALVVSRGE